MSNEQADEPLHRPSPAPPGAVSYLEFDLASELDQLRRAPAWATGQNAKTLVKYDSLRVVLMALKAHKRIPPHHANGRISIQTVHGHVQVRAEGRTFDLPRGGLLALDHERQHEVEALEDSALLLTIAWPGRT